MIFSRKKTENLNNDFLERASKIVGVTFTHQKGVLKILEQSVVTYNAVFACGCDHCNKLLRNSVEVQNRFIIESKERLKKDVQEFKMKNPNKAYLLDNIKY